MRLQRHEWGLTVNLKSKTEVFIILVSSLRPGFCAFTISNPETAGIIIKVKIWTIPVLIVKQEAVSEKVCKLLKT